MRKLAQFCRPRAAPFKTAAAFSKSMGQGRGHAVDQPIGKTPLGFDYLLHGFCFLRLKTPAFY